MTNSPWQTGQVGFTVEEDIKEALEAPKPEEHDEIAKGWFDRVLPKCQLDPALTRTKVHFRLFKLRKKY